MLKYTNRFSLHLRMNGQWVLKLNLLTKLKNLTLISDPDIVSSASVCQAHAVKHNLTTDVTKGAN